MSTPLSLSIMDREYKIACEGDERVLLQREGAVLDARMRELKARDKMLTLDRLAVLAALTLAQDALAKDTRFEDLSSSVRSELQRLNSQLDGVLGDLPHAA